MEQKVMDVDELMSKDSDPVKLSKQVEDVDELISEDSNSVKLSKQVEDVDELMSKDSDPAKLSKQVEDVDELMSKDSNPAKLSKQVEDVDELISKDSDPAKLSKQVEEVQMSVECNLDIRAEVSDESFVLETEFSRLPQVVDQNRQDFLRNMNAGEKFMQENILSAYEPNQSYFCDSKDMIKSVGAVRFEMAFMQNSLSRISCEDDDFIIDSHPAHSSQRNLKYSGANVSQTSSSTNRAAVSMPVNGKGCITNEASNPDEVISDTQCNMTDEDIITNEASNPDEVISDTQCNVTDEDIITNEASNPDEVISDTQCNVTYEDTITNEASNPDEVISDTQCNVTYEDTITNEASNPDEVISDTQCNVTYEDTITNEASNPDEDIFDTQCKVTDEDPVIQLVNSGVNDTDHDEESCKGDVGYDHVNEREVPSNMEKCGRHAAEHEFKATVEATACQWECKLSSGVIECQDQKQFTAETDNQEACDAGAKDCKLVNPDLSKDENVETFMVVCAQSYSDPGEMIQIGCEIKKKTDEAWLSPQSIKGTEPLTECRNSSESRSAIDSEITNECLNATDFESAVESAMDHDSAGESLIAIDFESAAESAIVHNIVGESLIASDFESEVESAMDHDIAGGSLIATDFENACKSAMDHNIAGGSLIATDIENACESTMDHEIADKCLNATNFESAAENVIVHIAGESLIATDFESAVESAMDHGISGESLIATDFGSAVESVLDHAISGESLIATDFESAVESAMDHEIAPDYKSAIESNSFCGSEALHILDFCQRQRGDIEVISDTCNDLTRHQNACEKEIIVEFCNQAQEKLKNTCTETDGTEIYSKHHIGNDFQIGVKAENTIEDRNEITREASEDFESDLNITTENVVDDEDITEGRNEIKYEAIESNFNSTTENAVKIDMNVGNNTEFYYKIFEVEQVNEIEHDIQDEWQGAICAAPFSFLIENAEVPRYQIKQDIYLKIKNEATDGSIDEKTDAQKENAENAVVDDIVADVDQHAIQVEHHPSSELDDIFDDDLVNDDGGKSDIADALRIENYSSEHVNMNENRANVRNELGNKPKTEIDGSDPNENQTKKELSKKMQTVHESHLEIEACQELEVETEGSKLVIQDHDEVDDKLETARLPISGHQTGIDKIQLQQDAENKMSEGLLIEGDSKTVKLFDDNNDDSVKVISGKICEISKDLINRKYETLGEKSASNAGKSRQIDEDEAICEFKNDVGVENEHVVVLEVNNYIDLQPENNDSFRQHAIAEIQNETVVANNEILNEAFQNGNSSSNIVDAAECVAVHGLTNVSLSDRMLEHNQASNIGQAKTELNFTPCSSQSQWSIRHDRSGVAISVESCCSEIGACITSSTEHHQMAVSQAFPKGNEKHLECSYQSMPPMFTGKTEVPDAFLESKLTQHDDMHGSEESSSIEVQDCYQNLRGVQKQAYDQNFFLSSTVEQFCSDTLNSSTVQARIMNCDVPTATVEKFCSDMSNSSNSQASIMNCEVHTATVEKFCSDMSNSSNIQASIMNCEVHTATVEKFCSDTSNSSNIQASIMNCEVHTATVEKFCSDTSNSYNIQASIMNCDVPASNAGFEEPMSVCDQFMTSNDENPGLIRAFGHCDDEITAFNYLSYVRGGAVELVTKCDRNVPDLEANEGDSDCRITLGDIPNQTDSFALREPSNKSQKHSTTKSANECIDHLTADQEGESSCSLQNAFSSENCSLPHSNNSRFLYSSTVCSKYVNRVNPDETSWSDVTLLRTESCFSKAFQNPTIIVDEPLLICEELLPVKNQLQADSGKHLQHELHRAEYLDVFAVPPLPTDSCAVYDGSSIREFNAFGKVSDVRVADMSSTESDFAERGMIRDQLKKRSQEVPSCYFIEDGLQMSTEKTSAKCISPRGSSSVARQIFPCSERAFKTPSDEQQVVPSDEQQVPSVESMKHGNQMHCVSYLPNHLEETLYEEPPVKRHCHDVGVGGNFDHDIDHKWCKDKQDTNPGGYRLTNLTGGGRERVPLYAWKNKAESDFEDHSDETEQSDTISSRHDTAAAVPLVIPQLRKCLKPLRLGLSRRYRARTQLHPNYKTSTDCTRDS